jgi:hypothetical protein
MPQNIHIVNPMWNAFGGSEQRVVNLYEALRAQAPVYIWSEQGADRRLSARVPVRRIDRSQQPMGGTLVVVGCYFAMGEWLASAHPRRVVLVVNTEGADAYKTSLDLVARTNRSVEMVYSSESLRTMVGVDGTVEASPVNLERFAPSRQPREGGRFVVGRMSRDVLYKHGEEDPLLYGELSRLGCEVRIMGGTCLAGRGCPPEVQLLPEGVIPPETFLQSLDCFVYRTATRWFETYGRVVIEAMACGLPAVVHRRGGYIDFVRDAENALLFDSTSDAVAHVLRVRDEGGVRERLGGSARETAMSLYSQDYWENLAAFYLRPG